MERPTRLTTDENTALPGNQGASQEDGRPIPRVVIESTGQTRFASSVIKVLSLQKFTKKTGRKSRDSWLERYTYHTTEDERDWRRPLMRRSASNSPQVLSPSSEGTGSSREASDNRLADMTDRGRCRMTLVFDPSGDAYLFWLFLVGLGIVYNWWTVIFRVAFFVREQKYVVPFMALDYSFDFIFFLDVIVQFRTGYFLDGKIVTDAKQLAKRYVKSLGFLLDCTSILPTDLLFLLLGPVPSLRFGRLLKSHRLFLFYDRVEIYNGHPKLFNLLKQIHYLFLIIHWVACLYFLISYLEGFGVDKWVHPHLRGQWAEVGPQYLFCLFRSLVSMTTVGTGKQVSPQTTMSLVFCIFTYLCGVLIFATIVGNTADVIVALRRHREKYHRKLDGMKEYITANQLPMDLQRRVIQWFDYAWRYKKDMSEEELFERLNDNFRAEIAIHVNLDTLKKVKMFEQCDPGFLRELVLKLKPLLCSPGDYVCRQDEIGREMYIVNKGGLEVIDKNENVLATLSAGRHFGEISILNMKGIGNRRTASVRSVGFSDLFRLSKSDLEEVLEYYPEVKEQLERIARQTYEKQRRERLNQTADTDDGYNVQNSPMKENDPRRWLVADKATLQRRLSLIEAKNDVRFLANKFRRENGHSVNPREIVAAMAQRVRKERNDEESRQIIKEFLAQHCRKKLPKRNTASYESLIPNKDISGTTKLENGGQDIGATDRRFSNEQLRKSQRKFFNRPRSRTQDPRPSSVAGNEIPLLTFSEAAINERFREDQAERKDLPSIPSSVHKLSSPGKIRHGPVVRKGILKRSSAEILPSTKWHLSDFRLSSSSQDNALSDGDKAWVVKESKHFGGNVPRDEEKIRKLSAESTDVKVVLAMPESSVIGEDSPEMSRKYSGHTTEKTRKESNNEIPYKVLSNSLDKQPEDKQNRINPTSKVKINLTVATPPAGRTDEGGVDGESTYPLETPQKETLQEGTSNERTLAGNMVKSRIKEETV